MTKPPSEVPKHLGSFKRPPIEPPKHQGSFIVSTPNHLKLNPTTHRATEVHKPNNIRKTMTRSKLDQSKDSISGFSGISKITSAIEPV